jgi:transcriptional regulator with XRE-family HTH domain
LSTKKPKVSLRQQFGHRIRTLRLRKRLTQEALAERAKLSVDFLSLIERGRNSPSFENLEMLASALDVPVRALFSFDDEAR